jgi:hypothetical protein
MGEKAIFVKVEVVTRDLDFNMLLGCDYVYSMNHVAFVFFHVMYSFHEGMITTIDKVLCYDLQPYSIIDCCIGYYYDTGELCVFIPHCSIST